MSDSEDEILLTQNSFSGSLVDVGEAVSNLFCLDDSSSSSGLPLPDESQRSCGDLEGQAEAEAPTEKKKAESVV